MRLVHAGALALVVWASGVCLLPTIASAQAPAEDVVYLRCGEPVRGHLREVVPKDHVTIVTTLGAIRTIPWSEVDRVVVAAEDGSEGLPPPPSRSEQPQPAPAPSPPRPLAPRATGRTVRIHIVSPDPVILYHRPLSTVDWGEACASPCDAEVPEGDEYEIAGVRGSRGPTKIFHLEGRGTRTVVLTVSPPSSVGTGLGVAMVIVGGLSLYVIGLAGLAGAAQNTCAGTDNQGCGVNGTYLGVLAAAAAVTTLGAILWHSSDKTDIEQVGDGQRKDDAPLPFLYQWRGKEEQPPRADVWRDVPPEVAATPPAFTVPILSGSF